MAFDKNKSIKKAQKYIQGGKIDAAIKEYVQIVKSDAKDTASLQKLAGLYAKKNQIEDAVRCYEQVGQTYNKNGFYQKALAVYKIALQLDAKNSELLTALAELYGTLGLKNEAVQHFQQAGNILIGQNENEKAIEVYSKMVELNPDDQAAKAHFGEALIRAGRKVEGMAVMKELSEFLAAEGKQEELSNFYERMLGFEPDDDEIRQNLARIYVRLGAAPKALKHLKILFEKGEKDPELFELVGRVYVLMGKNQKAVAAFEQKIAVLSDEADIEKTYQRILEIDPTNENALKHLGEEEDLNDETFFLTEEESKSTPVMPESTGSISNVGEEVDKFMVEINEASVYIKYGILDRAIAQLESVIEKDPQNVGAYERLVEAYKESGQNDEACAAAVQLAELYEAIGEMGKSNAMVEIGRKLSPNHPKLLEFTGEEASADAGPEIEDDTILGESGGAEALAIDLNQDDDKAFLDDEEDIMAETAVEFHNDPGTGTETVDLGDMLDDPEPAAEPAADDGALDIGFDLDDAADDEAADENEVTIMLGEGDGSLLEETASAEEETVSLEVEEQPEPEVPEYTEDLEQAEFLLEQGLWEEALAIVGPLQSKHNDSAIQDLHDRISAAKEQAKAQDEPVANAEEEAQADDSQSSDGFDFGLDDGFDLASELENELDFLEDEAMSPGEEDVPTVEEIFSEFKKGVKEQLDDSDASAHYDLGIAYMEMGLTEDAIGEFELASQSAEKAPDAYNMIAVAHTNLGQFPEAAKAYETALDLPDLTNDAELNLNFELACVLEDMKKYKQAIQHYKFVISKDKEYRNVVDRIKKLKEQLSK